MGSGALAVALPFSIIIGLLASITSLALGRDPDRLFMSYMYIPFVLFGFLEVEVSVFSCDWILLSSLLIGTPFYYGSSKCMCVQIAMQWLRSSYL